MRWKSLFLVCLLLSGCERGAVGSPPQIVFIKVPPADISDNLDTIEGLVTGVQPHQQIVLYAKSEGRWWIQPSAQDPFTQIQGGSKWKKQTHLGTDYAALLVDPGYDPPPSTEELPPPGGRVEAVAFVPGQGGKSSPTLKTLHFSGYDWVVRGAPSHRGGTRNSFNPDNAWTDERGALHLRIAKEKDQWSCAEVQLRRTLGYGIYVFVVRDISRLEPSAVLTLYTWDGAGPEQNRREVAFEISRWGNPSADTNTKFVVQPYYVPTNFIRFHAPAGVLTNSFHWEPAKVTFTTYPGSNVEGGVHPIKQHVFTSGVPNPHDHAARINLYVFNRGQVPLRHENEIVIERFAYYP